MLWEPTTKPLLRGSRAGVSSPSLPHCGAGWAHGESHGSAEFVTEGWRTSKRTAVGLSGSRLMGFSQVCCAS